MTIVLVSLAGLQLIGEILAGVVSRASRDISGPLLLFGPLVLLIFYNAGFWSLTGRTPGMALFGLRVTRTAGQPLGLLRALLRAVALTFLAWGIVWCPVDRRGQALHDKVAGSVVVYARVTDSSSPSPTGGLR